VVRRGQHLHVEGLSRCISSFSFCDLLFEASGFVVRASEGSCRSALSELVQIARDALLDLRHSPLHLGAREILVPIIDRLELAAIDGNARFSEEPIVRHSNNNPAADLADGPAVSLRKSAIVL